MLYKGINFQIGTFALRSQEREHTLDPVARKWLEEVMQQHIKLETDVSIVYVNIRIK